MSRASRGRRQRRGDSILRACTINLKPVAFDVIGNDTALVVHADSRGKMCVAVISRGQMPRRAKAALTRHVGGNRVSRDGNVLEGAGGTRAGARCVGTDICGGHAVCRAVALRRHAGRRHERGA